VPIKGEVPGLERAAADMLRHYDAGDLGVDRIDGCVIGLTHSEWAWWSWHESLVTAVGAIASGDAVVLFTVPADERAWLDAAFLVRNAGDNTISQLRVLSAAEYTSSATLAFFLVHLTTAATTLFWPDAGGKQTVTRIAPGPLLLEPGSVVELLPAGVGSVGSDWIVSLLMRRTRIHRQRTP